MKRQATNWKTPAHSYPKDVYLVSYKGKHIPTIWLHYSTQEKWKHVSTLKICHTNICSSFIYNSQKLLKTHCSNRLMENKLWYMPKVEYYSIIKKEQSIESSLNKIWMNSKLLGWGKEARKKRRYIVYLYNFQENTN